jgi:hypothetical protein
MFEPVLEPITQEHPSAGQTKAGFQVGAKLLHLVDNRRLVLP